MLNYYKFTIAFENSNDLGKWTTGAKTHVLILINLYPDYVTEKASRKQTYF